jgi:hypothetical protein
MLWANTSKALILGDSGAGRTHSAGHLALSNLLRERPSHPKPLPHCNPQHKEWGRWGKQPDGSHVAFHKEKVPSSERAFLPTKLIYWNFIGNVIILRPGAFRRWLNPGMRVFVKGLDRGKFGLSISVGTQICPHGGHSHKTPSWKQRAALARHQPY